MLLRLCTKTVALSLALFLAIPSALLFYPATASAQATTCAARAGGAIAGMLGLSQAAGAITAVPTNDLGNKAAFTTSATSNFGEFFGDCILKPIALRLANAMLHNITVSIVNWINSGFHGNPSFVKDFKGMLQDSTDQVIGQFIQYDLGAGFLCQPFSLQVKIALAQTYLPFKERATCTLTQISDNVDNAINNDGGIGWDNWLEVTTEPQNNVYGATIIAQTELTRRIAEKLEIQNKQLDWGKGFRGQEICTVMYLENGDTAPAPATMSPSDPRCADSEVRTPGTVIENQLVTALGSDMRKLEVAQDLDAIIGALTNQLMAQVVKGTQGLLGAGRNPSGTYGSVGYSEALNSNITDPNLAAAIDNGVESSSAEANLGTLFTFDLSTTTVATTTDDTAAPPVEENRIDLVIASTTPVVNGATPFVYQANITANYTASHLSIETTLKRNGVAVPLVSLFSNPQIAFGYPQNTANRYATGDEAGARFQQVTVRQDSPFTVKATGTKKDGAPTGTFILETTVTDSEGALVDSRQSSFIVQ